MEKEHCCVKLSNEVSLRRVFRYNENTERYSIRDDIGTNLIIEWCPFCGMYLRGNKDAITKKQK